MQQHEEALRQLLHLLGHRGRGVHQAEHHRLGGGPGQPLEAVVADVDRVDIGDGFLAPFLDLQLGLQGGDLALAAALALQRRDLLLQRVDLFRLRAVQGDPPGQAAAHGAQHVQAGGRALGGEAGAGRLGRFFVLDLGLQQIRQFQILEEHVQEFLLGEGEDEFVIALAVGTSVAAAGLAGRALGDQVAGHEFLVAGRHAVTAAVIAGEAEGRLAHGLGADLDPLAAFDLGHPALLHGVAHRLADVGLGAADEALAVAKALAFRVQTAVDDVHGRPLTFLVLTHCDSCPGLLRQAQDEAALDEATGS